ncbi:hypothetical protein N5C66_22750 [Rhizobium pusense]|uniref:hypothetical protein n=1 Tax=Agrobacterium pusense TaxID=648995 RepID=UPI000D1AD050|nr:hypothetical protein [Agrobacterium pusense]MDH0910445.1 hypothetical protein [Agrobacterium pusense]MDH1098440.1 hypothetical protein [Agrobacterium pusense]MDH1114550.1 hypothetical protein [Agrobacterium pusense]MDH2195686.1 hypothetical protein [Agrobacterium pusense]
MVSQQPVQPRPDGTLTRLRAEVRELHKIFAETINAIAAGEAVSQAHVERVDAIAKQGATYLGGLAIFLIGASLAQVVFGLRPMAALTMDMDRIRERHGGRLEGVLPREFRPVETAINRLIDAQTQTLVKARVKTADLAQGLETPLAALSNDATTLRDKGETGMADEIDHLVGVMLAHVNGELA